MSANASLPFGAFTTQIGGKQCTAVPRTNGTSSSSLPSSTSTSTSTSNSTSSSTSMSGSFTIQQATIADPQPAIATTTGPAFSIAEVTTTSLAPTSTLDSTTQVQATSTDFSVDAVSAETSTTSSSTTLSSSSATFSTSSQISTSIGETSTTAAAAAVSSITTSATAETTQQQPGSSTTSSSINSGGVLITATTNDPRDATATAGTDQPTQTGALGLSTTGVDAAATSVAVAATTAGSDSGGNGVSHDAAGTGKTAVVVGGVIGGVAALGLVLFLIWFCRRRVTQKRRSAMLTPLDPDQKSPRYGKEEYTISRGSIGPTPLPVRMKASLETISNSIRGRLGGSPGGSASPGVNMDRGHSQFLEDPFRDPTHNSMLGRVPEELTTKDRIKNWWSRFDADTKFNWQLRNGSRRKNDGILGGSTRERSKGNMRLSPPQQPDFFALVGRDSEPMAPVARPPSARRGPRRHSRHTESISSSDHFLGQLNLSTNPFSDSFAMSHDSARVQPLEMPNRPQFYGGANTYRPPSQAGPTTYVQQVNALRRSSASPSPINAGPRRSSAYRPPSSSSRSSLESFETRRNKIKSDPFDLDKFMFPAPSAPPPRPPSSGRISPNSHQTGPRQGSYAASSRYSSTGPPSLDEWSDPGPDIGPTDTGWQPRPPQPGHHRDGGGGRVDPAQDGFVGVGTAL